MTEQQRVRGDLLTRAVLGLSVAAVVSYIGYHLAAAHNAWGFALAAVVAALYVAAVVWSVTAWVVGSMAAHMVEKWGQEQLDLAIAEDEAFQAELKRLERGEAQ